MANTDIFLGSGASITFVPENDIYVGGKHTNNGAFDGTNGEKDTIKVDWEALLLFGFNNLYRGCIVELYDSSEHIVINS